MDGRDAVIDDHPPHECVVLLSHDGEGTLARLQGDLEVSSARVVETTLDAALRSRPTSLTVSLEGLEFLDSSGLRMLLLLHRNATRLGVGIRFVGPRGAVRRTLAFARALDYLGITD